jgi:HAD superfamily hydrolase (TIGR01450 family)
VRLDDVRGFVFDVDGTLVHRAGIDVYVQPGAPEVLDAIRASGRPVALFTNGTHAAPEAFALELREAGLDIADDEMLTPLRSALVYLRANYPDGSMLLFSNRPSRAYLESQGVHIVEGDAATRADVVFVGTPEALDFAELERGARIIRAGAPLLTGSYASAYAGANGPIISRGAMTAAALTKAGNIRRPLIVGKPSRWALRTISDRLGMPTRDLVVIGDDVTMDVAIGRMGGARTILVRSGMSGAVGLDGLPKRQQPDAVVGGVADLLEWL